MAQPKKITECNHYSSVVSGMGHCVLATTISLPLIYLMAWRWLVTEMFEEGSACTTTALKVEKSIHDTCNILSHDVLDQYEYVRGRIKRM